MRASPCTSTAVALLADLALEVDILKPFDFRKVRGEKEDVLQLLIGLDWLRGRELGSSHDVYTLTRGER